MKPNPFTYEVAPESENLNLVQIIERGYTGNEEHDQLMLDASLLKQEGYFADFTYIARDENGTFWKRRTIEPSPVAFVSFGGVVTLATFRLELEKHPSKYSYLFADFNPTDALDVLSVTHDLIRTDLTLQSTSQENIFYLWIHGRLADDLKVANLTGI